MDAYATLSFLPHTQKSGRSVRRALVELSDAGGGWLGAFTVFGFSADELKDRAYMEADLNASHKGYTLQSMRCVG